MKQLLDAFIYRGIAIRPLSTRHLFEQVGITSNNSVTSLLRASGPFVASRDAYKFSNSPGQGFTREDAQVLREHYQALVDQTSLIGIAALKEALTSLAVPVPILGSTGLPGAVVVYVINRVTEDLRNELLDSIIASVPGRYGRCGGMVFSALDCFLVGWPIPVDTVQPGFGPIRDYIWRRLLDSLVLNAATFLEWGMILQILPVISMLASAALGAAAGSVGGPLGAALGALLAGDADVLKLGGAHALLAKTRENCGQLQVRLGGSAAWPIGFVHGGGSSPVDQHQVLALGYSDFGDGTAALDIWDNNDVAICRRLHLDMRGYELSVSSSNSDLNEIKGIICEDYSPIWPPQSLRLQNQDVPSHWIPGQCS